MFKQDECGEFPVSAYGHETVVVPRRTCDLGFPTRTVELVLDWTSHEFAQDEARAIAQALLKAAKEE